MPVRHFARRGDLKRLFDADQTVESDWTFSGAVTFSGTVTLPEAAVTDHQAALTILETQITDGTLLARLAANETVVGDWTFSGTLSNAQGEIASGTYTPTLTHVANLDASTAFACHWMRVGNVVTVAGQVNMDATTAGTLTRLRMSLPIAATFSDEADLGGAAISRTHSGNNAAIQGELGNNEAEFRGFPDNASNSAFFFTFTYEI